MDGIDHGILTPEVLSMKKLRLDKETVRRMTQTKVQTADESVLRCDDSLPSCRNCSNSCADAVCSKGCAQ